MNYIYLQDLNQVNNLHTSITVPSISPSGEVKGRAVGKVKMFPITINHVYKYKQMAHYFSSYSQPMVVMIVHTITKRVNYPEKINAVLRDRI